MVQTLVKDLAERGLQLLQQDRLQAGWNQRTPHRRGYRNGHYRRALTTPHGRIVINVPRCRDGSDGSLVFDRYRRRLADVRRVLRHAYLAGASTRAVAALGEQIFGDTLSHQTVSRLLRWLDDQLDRWRRRPIAAGYTVVYVDGMHVDVIGGDRMVMVVAGQRGPQDPLEVLGFCLSSGEQCVELLSDLRRRGLEGMELVVSDESGAIRAALERVYPEVAWQHCTFHRLKALRDRIGPTDFRNLMTAEAGCIFRCPSKLAAVDAAVAWARRWKRAAPAAVAAFMEDLSDSLTFYSLPSAWWRRARTNNPLERLIRTLRDRLRPMGCFDNSPAVERAVFGQLLRRHLIKLTHNP
jgi:transposase-like protein